MTESITLSKQDLQKMIDDAAKKAATDVLEKIGLGDETAKTDLEDLRRFISSMRFVRNTAIRGFIQSLVDKAVTIILLILAMKYFPQIGSHTSDLIPPIQ